MGVQKVKIKDRLFITGYFIILLFFLNKEVLAHEPPALVVFVAIFATLVLSAIWSNGES